MRPRVRVDLAARRLLDAVVADGAGGIEGIRDLGRRERFEELGARGMVRPDAREAVGLELRADRGALGAAGVARLLQEAKQVLDVRVAFGSPSKGTKSTTRSSLTAKTVSVVRYWSSDGKICVVTGM